MQGLKGMAQVKAEITDSRAKATSFQSPNPAYSLTLFKKNKMLWNPCGFWLWFGRRIEAWFLVAWAICSQDPGLLQTSRCLSFSVHTTSTQLQPSATRCQRLRIDFSLHPASRPPLGNHHKESRVGVREQRTWETATDIWLVTLWHAFAPCCFDLESSYLGILKRIKSMGGGMKHHL